MAIPVKLPVFEGPLDLLLHLIEKNKIDIYDIPIAGITDQYLEYVRQMDHEDLDVTSEFLVMAATLLDIKSRMLLPREKDDETGEEEGDPREELVRRLLEYKMYKYLSEELAVYREQAGVRYFRAFAKVGTSYAQGEVKSIGAPMLLDVAFAADGTAANYAFTKQTCVKHGSPAMTYNADYKRYEADLSANSFSSTAGHYYSIRFLYDDEFMARLADGHTLEAVVKVPYLTSTSESDILANYENGGTGIGIQNKTFFAQAYTGGIYRSVYDQDDLDDKDGTYHHVVSVYDQASATLFLYIDGQLVNSKPAPGRHTMPTTSNARYYMVGGNPDSSSNCVASWNSSVVFTRIYDDALTASQVQTLYNNLKK